MGYEIDKWNRNYSWPYTNTDSANSISATWLVSVDAPTTQLSQQVNFPLPRRGHFRSLGPKGTTEDPFSWLDRRVREVQDAAYE